MANKRTLKKSIRYTCGDIAGECIFAKYTFEHVDCDAMDNAILNAAELQSSSLSKISVAFDRTFKTFDGDAKAYKKARRDYFKKCFTQLWADFTMGIEEIVKEMNAALPQTQKDANKKALEEK